MTATPRPRSPRKRQATLVGDLLGGALRELGMPSARLSARVLGAWDRVADPAWRGVATPQALDGGVLLVAVTSSALREELAQFHRARLLEVLRAALPDVPLIGIRFMVGENRPRPSTSGDDR